MANDDTKATWAYHDGTKHSPESVRRSRHVLDWDNMPLSFKVYVDLEPAPIPRDFTVSSLPALAAISTPARGGAAALDRTLLARLLHFSAGVVRRRAVPGGEMYYRAAACTGALYHIDLYLVTGALPDLEAGVYHFSPHDFSLRCLRRGDHRGVLVRASGGDAAIESAPVIAVCTSTFWRNAWKYQARTYRHCFWDDGTILANLLAVASAGDVRADVVLGFDDAEVNRLLDLDPLREVALSLVALGQADASPAPAPAFAPLGFKTLPLSPVEVDYPAIRAMHEASSLPSGDAAAAWHRSSSPKPRAPAIGTASTESVEAVILRRGSTRHFAGRSIGADQLDAILRAATAPLPSDFTGDGALTQIYAIANTVDGLEAGTYVYEAGALKPLRRGDFRREAGFLDLGQDLARDAAVNLYWLADLGPILAGFGNRGYRAAQLDGAIGGGRTYLASYAQRLGATGLTFFDDAVIDFFSPHAAGKSVMFLMAVGRGGSLRMA